VEEDSADVVLGKVGRSAVKGNQAIDQIVFKLSTVEIVQKLKKLNLV
jgi:hypothetical protein